MSARAGFIGLGSQGAPMARRITDAGIPLVIWARRPETVEPFADTAAVVAATPAEVGAQSDIVGICVVNDADVEDVVLRDDGVLAGMSPGGVIAIHSTVHPDTCRRLAEAAAPFEVAIVDAPVSGGSPAASVGTLLVMAGGNADDVERCRPIFETYGDPVLYLGKLGSGEMAKLLNNFVFTAQVAAAIETYDFAGSLGMDLAAVAQVLTNGSGGSRAATIVGANPSAMRSGSPLLEKDVGLMLDVARSRGVAEPPLLTALANRTLTGSEE